MKKKIISKMFVIVSVLFIALYAFFVIGDYLFRTMPGTPPIPNNGKLSNNAFWAGGPDGGDWFELIEKQENCCITRYYIRIYSDWTFQLIYEGWFSGKNYRMDNLKESIRAYNGIDISLENNDTLTPVMDKPRLNHE